MKEIYLCRAYDNKRTTTDECSNVQLNRPTISESHMYFEVEKCQMVILIVNINKYKWILYCI